MGIPRASFSELNSPIDVPILLMPGGLLVVNFCLVIGAGALFYMIFTTAGKSFEVWRRSVHDTTLNLLYTKIERYKRRRAIAFNSALVKPLAEVSAAIVLWLTVAEFHRALLLVVTIIWLLATYSLIKLVRNPNARRHPELVIENQTLRLDRPGS